MAFLALAVLAASVWVMRPLFDAAVVPQGEGILLVYPDRMLQGFVPNRDFYPLYGPGNYWVLAAAFKIFGATVQVERSVGLVYRLAIILCVLLLGSRRGRGVGIGCAALALIALSYQSLAAHAWYGATAFGLWSIWVLSTEAGTARTRHWIWGLGGLLAGFAVSIRFDTPALALAAAISILLVGTGWRERRSFLGGAVLGTTPLWWHAIQVGPQRIWEDGFIEPVLRFGYARRLPIPPPDPAVAKLFFLGLACTALLIVAGLVALTREQGPSRTVLPAIAAFGACLTPQALQRADIDHVLFVAAIVWGLMPLALASLLRRSALPRRSWRFQALVVTLALLLVAAGAWPRVRNAAELSYRSAGLLPLDHADVTNRNRSVPVASNVAPYVSAVLGDIERLARVGERLYVGPHNLVKVLTSDVYLYFLLPQLTPASFYWETNPGSLNRAGGRLASDLATADLIVLDREYDDPGEPNIRAEPGGVEAMKVIDRRFTTCTSRGPFEVLLRNDLAAARGCGHR